MSKQKDILGRIVHKHDLPSNWAKATNFIPKQGELIVYDPEGSIQYERVKMGDGKTPAPNLPFLLSNELEAIVESLNTKVSVSRQGNTLVFTTNAINI